MNPLVSIIIPVYNGQEYMREAIDSALNQTYKNIEILVINDGSKDNTEEIALSYGDKIRYFSKENGGVSSALNLGIKEMKGEYFSWLSHDDKYEPQKIEKQIELISEFDDEKLILVCSTKFIDKNSCDLKRHTKKCYNYNKVYTWEEALIHLFEKGALNGCALLIPKKAFLEAGNFDERLRYCQDYLMWVKIFLKEYSMIFDEYIGVCSRVHEKQQTQTIRPLFYKDLAALGEMVTDELCEKSTKKYNLLYSFSKNNAKNKNFVTLNNCIKLAKTKELFTVPQILKLRMISFWGILRPTVRRIYFRLFRKMKTQ